MLDVDIVDNLFGLKVIELDVIKSISCLDLVVIIICL